MREEEIVKDEQIIEEKVMDGFREETRSWFQKTLGEPTIVQSQAWQEIRKGNHVLVSAPTGTGKTLTAFLCALDRLLDLREKKELKEQVYIIYISPLKSLAADIRENLHRPLFGIYGEQNRENKKADPWDISIGIRTGDTTTSERNNMIHHPPHILITTPESLFLLLTSTSGKKILKTAELLILDEIHAVMDTKRGAHLNLSVARLEALCEGQLQKIGLSATVDPLEAAARFLGGQQVSIVAPEIRKEIEIFIKKPVIRNDGRNKKSFWNFVAEEIYTESEKRKSILVFCDGRAFVEKLAFYINQIGGSGYCLTHHGSMSHKHRMEAEKALKEGRLKILAATSSMELGIDVGEIELVLQIGCPKSVAGLLQRLGRSGHRPDEVSHMILYPKTDTEILDGYLTTLAAKERRIEKLRPQTDCFDVLAQHLVSMAADQNYSFSDVMKLLKISSVFKHVTKNQLIQILEMLSGKYEREERIPVSPRIRVDFESEMIYQDNYSRMLAIRSGGTIPDKGLFTVKTEQGVKVGEVDEEFVFEARKGDKFLLGSFSWQITAFDKNKVTVRQSSSIGARPPFYKAETSGRTYEIGKYFGECLDELLKKDASEREEFLQANGLDHNAAHLVNRLLQKQIESTGTFPDHKHIVIEHFKDDTGNAQLMVHSVFGRKVNAPLSILVREAAMRRMKMKIVGFEDEEGFLLFPYGDKKFPEGLLYAIDRTNAIDLLKRALPQTPAFQTAFRYNAARALMMGIRNGQRQPLWVQRLRSAQMLDSILKYPEHPLIVETVRECFQFYWDLDGMLEVLDEIQKGEIEVVEIHTEIPSPMSLPFRRAAESVLLYEYNPLPENTELQVKENLQNVEGMDPDNEYLNQTRASNYKVRNKHQLYDHMLQCGEIQAGEIEMDVEWIKELEEENRIYFIEPGYWITREQSELYQSAFRENDPECIEKLLFSRIFWHGGQTLETLTNRYLVPEKVIKAVLKTLITKKAVIEERGCFYSTENYEIARRKTILNRRNEISTNDFSCFIQAGIKMIERPQSGIQGIKAVLEELANRPFSYEEWFYAIFPNRVLKFRIELLDKVLKEGEYFWSLNREKQITFHPYSEIDWDEDLGVKKEENKDLDDVSLSIYDTIIKRGSTLGRNLLDQRLDTRQEIHLIELVKRGLLHGDSVFPLELALYPSHLAKSGTKQKVTQNLRMKDEIRWECTRRQIKKGPEEIIKNALQKNLILTKENLEGITWQEGLQILGLWEFRGQVQRGYFIESLYGIQFIAEERFREFKDLCLMNEMKGKGKKQKEDILWVSALDPIFKTYPMKEKELSFTRLKSTILALHYGKILAVAEQNGKKFKLVKDVSEEEIELLLTSWEAFFDERRIYPDKNRIVLKEYGKIPEELLQKSGFIKEMTDFVKYRKPL